MKEVCVINYHSKASVYGVGTYLKEYLFCLNSMNFKVNLIELGMNGKNDFSVLLNGNVRTIYLPYFTINNTIGYNKGICRLFRLYIQDSENLVFHLNIADDNLLNSIKRNFPLSKSIFAIHYLSWSEKFQGNIDLYNNIIRNRGKEKTKVQYGHIIDDYEKEKALLKQVDRIVCLSDDTLNLLKNIYEIKQNVWLIPNGLRNFPRKISNNQKMMLREKYYISPNEKILLFVGRVDSIKGIEPLLACFDDVIKEYPNCRLVVIGSGTIDIFVKHCKKSFSKVIITGRKNKKTLFKWYQIADVALFPSLYEECSYVGIEMMMHGLPIVASDGYSVKNMFHEGVNAKIATLNNWGRITKYRDNLKKTILHILNSESEALELRKGAKKTYQSKYSIEKMQKGYTDLFDSFNMDNIQLKNMNSSTKELKEKHNLIKDFLEKKYMHVISHYNDLKISNSVFFIDKDSPVWVCWWQGVKYMPFIVRICYESICRNLGTHPVRLITKDNYAEYISLPDYIIEKLNSGNITITHFSTILRMNLLYQYGGYWIDATVLLTKTLYEEKKLHFFTVKDIPDPTFPANGRWTTFVFGGGKHGLLFDFSKTFLNEYWKHESAMIDYYLIDYVIDLAYDHLPAVRIMIDENDFYLPEIYNLSNILNQPFNADKFDTICKETCFHKLSWKRRYPTEIEDGNQSFYGYLFNKNQELKLTDIENVISYYFKARQTNNKEFEKKAEELMDNIIEDIANGSYTENNIYRIGCNIIYLLRNAFIEGNEDDLLSEIDDIVLRDICYRDQNRRLDLYNRLHYLKLRTIGNPENADQFTLLKNKQHLCFTLDEIKRDNTDGNILDKRLVDDMEDIFHTGLACGLVRNILKLEHNKDIRLENIEENAITFVIPVRINFLERKRNLLLLLKQLKKIPNASIIILEADRKPFLKFRKNNKISYYFIEDNDPVFYKTKYINMMLSEAKTKIAGVWDTDVVVPSEQIISSIQDIKNGCLMSYPYDGRFFTLSPEESEHYCNIRSLQFLMDNVKHFSQDFGTNSTGGAYLVNKNEFLKFGGENEHFYGWGPEDAERVKRVEILGFEIQRAKGPLFHLYHPRKSWFNNENTELANRSEFVKVCSMTRCELIDYIKTWTVSNACF